MKNGKVEEAPRQPSLVYIAALRELSRAGGTMRTFDLIRAVGRSESGVWNACKHGLAEFSSPVYGMASITEKGKALLAELDRIPNGHKVCQTCAETKPATEFYATQAGTCKSDCKPCYSAAVVARKKARQLKAASIHEEHTALAA